MKIVFMGTPDFAAQSLQALIDSPHEVAAVFTRVDKPRNRGKKITFSLVKELAMKHEIPVYQPLTLKPEKSTEALEILQEINPDCIVVAAYGMILPQEVLDLSEYGCINVHASLLPKYRGAAPINRCIMNGETESGVTIIKMDSGIDTGDMLLWESIPIHEAMTATELHDVLAELGAKLLIEALTYVGEGSTLPQKQDDSLSCYAEMLTKAECEIDFTKPAHEVNNHIRGLADYPCAYTFVNEKRMKVFRAEVGGNNDSPLTFTCGDGNTITFTEIQPEGGKQMLAADYLKGVK